MSMERAAPILAFFQNPVFLASITSWATAQVVKAFIAIVSSRHRGLKDVLAIIVWSTGGMPSSHAAVVSSMVTSVGATSGLGSNLFVVSFFIALIIMRDAMGVRRSSGLQGKLLNTLGRQVAEKLGIEFHPVKEVHGHRPLEVIVGCFLGIFIAMAFAFL